MTTDEGPRRDTSLEKMAELKPLREGWELTAGHRLADLRRRGRGADRVARRRCERHGLTPRARIHRPGGDRLRPGLHADRRRSRPPSRRWPGPGWSIDDIDVFEVNEAFAPVLLAWSADTGASLEQTNPNGGAIALGHPLGATGAILMTKLLHELERTGGRYGLQTMCEGGGQANATIIERLGLSSRTAGSRSKDVCNRELEVSL